MKPGLSGIIGNPRGWAASPRYGFMIVPSELRSATEQATAS